MKYTLLITKFQTESLSSVFASSSLSSFLPSSSANDSDEVGSNDGDDLGEEEGATVNVDITGFGSAVGGALLLEVGAGVI